MDSLVIRLTGTVQQSNFDQWKVELIERIKDIDTRLVTSDDFAAATEPAKDLAAAKPEAQPRSDTEHAANESFQLVIDILASRQVIAKKV